MSAGSAVTCPCGGRACVLETRNRYGVIKRRRRCTACGATWTTSERKDQG